MMTVTRKREGGVEPTLRKKKWSQPFEKKKTLHRVGRRMQGLGLRVQSFICFIVTAPSIPLNKHNNTPYIWPPFKEFRP